ncbi:hypothetical protein LSAT2_021871 [Lamellibrachia satsuma]|nr:hypothetical protein LSAT2_021871 [Lamellibrachia satsuma]
MSFGQVCLTVPTSGIHSMPGSHTVDQRAVAHATRSLDQTVEHNLPDANRRPSHEVAGLNLQTLTDHRTLQALASLLRQYRPVRLTWLSPAGVLCG